MSNNQTVESRLIPLSKLPLISKEDNLKKALDLMTEKRLGIALIIDSGIFEKQSKLCSLDLDTPIELASCSWLNILFFNKIEQERPLL